MLIGPYPCKRCRDGYQTTRPPNGPYCPRCRRELIQGERTYSRAELEARIPRLTRQVLMLAKAIAASQQAVTAREPGMLTRSRRMLIALGLALAPVALPERQSLELVRCKHRVARSRLATVRRLLREGIPEAQESHRERERGRRARVRALAQASAERRQGVPARRAELTPEVRYLRSEGDYNRGNPVDNYIRREWRPALVRLFGGACAICSGTRALCLDHWRWPKNAGGNLVLVEAEGLALASNVLVLCVSCNSAKRDTPVDRLLTQEAADRIVRIAHEVTAALRSDPRLCKKLSRWYRVRVVPTEPPHPAVPQQRILM
jgi:hypothetical protein